MPPIRVFVSRAFDRFTHRERIDDEVLINAIEEIERGLIDAELGGNVYKKRIARRGEGKSSSYRTIVVFRSGDRAVFIEGFPKIRERRTLPMS